MKREMTIVRIYLREADPGHHDRLLNEILSILHDQHQVHGVTVLRGIVGFGPHGDIHSADLMHPIAHLPLVVEFYDEPEIVTAAIEALGDLVPEGRLLTWNILCELGPQAAADNTR